VILMTLAGVLALDVGLVAGLAGLRASRERRARREIEQLESLWQLPSGRPTARPVRSATMRRKLIAAPMLVAVLGVGTAYAHPATRELVGSIVDSVMGERVETATGFSHGSALEGGAERSPAATRSEAPRGAAADPRTVGPDLAPTAGGPARAVGHDAPRPPIVGPATPATFVATPTSSSTIVLTWSDVASESGYRIDRSADGHSGWVTIAIVPADVTAHSDSGLPAGITFYYRIVATGVGGTSPPSGVTSGTTDLPLVSPENLTASAASSSAIELAWTDVGAATGYRIERSDDGGTGWAVIATTGRDVTTFSDTALPPGTTFSYRVVALNAGGESPPSSVASATTSMEAERPVPTLEPPPSEPPASEARTAA
jgi:hypothetical protein